MSDIALPPRVSQISSVKSLSGEISDTLLSLRFSPLSWVKPESADRSESDTEALERWSTVRLVKPKITERWAFDTGVLENPSDVRCGKSDSTEMSDIALPPRASQISSVKSLSGEISEGCS